MKINTYTNGELKENCYLIYNETDALIIDPGSIILELEKFVIDNNLKVIGILITHYHKDHTGALDYYKKLYNVNIYDFESDEKVKINEFNFKIIKCFGHTLDSVSFYFEEENIMFTGDFLFKETIGNYELKNEKEMYKSLSNILQLDKSIKIYPGHDEATTLEYEIENNPYLRGL